MDVLKRQIEERKRKLAEAQAAAPKKYLSKAELDRQREAAYLKEQEELEALRRRKLEEKLASRRVAPAVEERKEVEYVARFPVDEVKRRLRRRGEPITLFGETDALREKRLVELEAAGDEALAQGGRNDFLRDLKQADEDPSSGLVGGSTEDWAALFAHALDPQPADMDDNSYVVLYFQRLLRMAELEVASAAPDVRATPRWAHDAAKMRQTKRWMRPLFTKIQKKTADPTQMEHFVEIVRAMRQREYVLASDWYLRLAIGNSAWPMGVTMVGIHARSAREKISKSATAHVLNDETTRCYIQAVKRLMTFQQKHFPHADPTHNLN